MNRIPNTLKLITGVLMVLLASVATGQTINKAPVAPEIDGSVDEVWKYVEAWQLNVLASEYDAADLSATAKVLWDENNIYYLVEVTDDALSDDGDAEQPWTDDSVEIYIDGGNEKATTYDDNDAQITMRRTMRTQPGGSASNYDGKITWMTSETETGYIVEMALSLVDFPQAVGDGTQIGYEFQINDDDDGGAGDGYIKLVASGSSWRNPSLFGTATLSETVSGPRILKTNTAPSIDGEADVLWDFVTPWELTLNADQYEPEDLSATAKVLWDENNIYYLVEVTDDALSDDGDAEQPWTDDSVEIYIDGGNEKATSYDDNDAQITMRRTMRTEPGGSASNYDGKITWMTSETPTGYIVEMALSLVDFPQVVGDGTRIGVEFQINDDDDGGAGDGYIKMFDTGSSWRNPSLMASATLVDDLAGPTIYKAVSSPVVDGEPDVIWDFANPIALTLNAADYASNDLSATAKVVWDDVNIYYLVTVMDDELSDDSEETSAWQDDSVEIYIDGGNEKATSYDDNDAQLSLRRTMSTPVQGGSSANYADVMTWATSEMADGVGYYVEMSIPLSSLSQEIMPGSVIGMEFQINDDDDGEGPDGNIKAFNSGSSWRNPSLFADATFSGNTIGPKIYRAEISPVVDGELDPVWDTFSGWDVLLRTEDYEPNDLRANAKMLWDDTHLYYLVTVMDDELSDDSEEASAWQDDSVEIYIDGGNEKATSYDDNDAQLTLRRTMSTPVQGGSNENYAGVISWATSEMADGVGYFVEMSIPLSAIPQTIEAGVTRIGADFQINDDDDGEGSDGSIKLFNPGSSWRNPSLFESVLFSNELPPEPIILPPPAPEPALMITGVLDGGIGSGLPKVIELYAFDEVTDLSLYAIGTSTNGGGSEGEEFVLSGSASAGSYIYIASESVEFTNVFGSAPTLMDAAIDFDGNDAVELYLMGALIDVFGNVDEDGSGTAWEYTDSWAYRLDSASSPNEAFNAEEWYVEEAGELAGLNAGEVMEAIPFGSFPLFDGPESNLPWAEVETGETAISPWFGQFTVGGSDWINHTELGWTYVGFVEDAEDMWLYSLYWSNWLWTDIENFPMLYNVSTGSYIYYLILSDEEVVYLFDYSTMEWIIQTP